METYYKIRKPHKRLANTIITPEDYLIDACRKANNECYGKYSSYEVYKYEDNKLVVIYTVRVVRPEHFDKISFPNLTLRHEDL